MNIFKNKTVISNFAYNLSIKHQIPIDSAIRITENADKKISLIENGANFGEEDGFDPGYYFKFKLISVDKEKYEMIVTEPGNTGNPGPKTLDVMDISSLIIDEK